MKNLIMTKVIHGGIILVFCRQFIFVTEIILTVPIGVGLYILAGIIGRKKAGLGGILIFFMTLKVVD